MARARAKTEWVGWLSTHTLTGPSQGEAILLDAGQSGAAGDEFPKYPATLIRTRANIQLTFTRTSVVTTAALSEGADIVAGIMMEESQSTSAADLDLRDAEHLSDDRWLWTYRGRLDAPSVWAGYWNGTAQVDRYTNIPDARGIWLDVDIRAKRRWTDVSMLSWHMSWETVGTAPVSVTARMLYRCLFRMH